MPNNNMPNMPNKNDNEIYYKLVHVIKSRLKVVCLDLKFNLVFVFL